MKIKKMKGQFICKKIKTEGHKMARNSPQMFLHILAPFILKGGCKKIFFGGWMQR